MDSELRWKLLYSVVMFMTTLLAFDLLRREATARPDNLHAWSTVSIDWLEKRYSTWTNPPKLAGMKMMDSVANERVM